MSRAAKHQAHPTFTLRRAYPWPPGCSPAPDRAAGSASAAVLVPVAVASSVQATPVVGGWFDRGLAVLACGVLCTLMVAVLLSIAWLVWVQLDEGRAVDYRRRTDAAMHRGSGGRTNWLGAARAEAAYAVGYLHERLGTRRPRPH